MELAPDMFVFLPISDTEWYNDYDHRSGYGGCDQLDVDGGIIVLKTKEKMFRDHIETFESYASEHE